MSKDDSPFPKFGSGEPGVRLNGKNGIRKKDRKRIKRILKWIRKSGKSKKKVW